MKEQIESLNFNSLTEEETNNFLSSLLELPDDELKESIINIIDKIELSQVSDETMPKSYQILFENSRISTITNQLYEEFGDDVEDVEDVE